MTDSNKEEPKYYINMHVGGKLMCDLYLRYDGGISIRTLEDRDMILYFELCNIMQKDLAYHALLSLHYYISSSMYFDDVLRLIWNDSIIIDMLNIWYKNKVIDFVCRARC